MHDVSFGDGINLTTTTVGVLHQLGQIRYFRTDSCGTRIGVKAYYQRVDNMSASRFLQCDMVR